CGGRGAGGVVAVEDEDRGTPLRVPEGTESLLDAIEVVGVAHPQDVPPVRQESGGDVLREGEARRPFDSDVVVVVDPAEVVQTQVTGEGGGFRRDALHQATVPTYRVDVVVEDRETRSVVAGGEQIMSDGNRHSGSVAIAE